MKTSGSSRRIFLDAATKFYASGIYTDKFETAELDDKDSDLPKDFMQLALFSKTAEMRQILTADP